MKSQLVVLGGAIAMAFLPLPVGAQPSTRNVSGPVTRFDLSAGAEAFGQGYRAVAGGLALSAHTRLEEGAGFAATAWLLGRNTRLTRQGPSPQTGTSTERVLMLEVALEARFRMGADVLLSPLVGVGFSPWVHLSGYRGDPQGGPGLIHYSETSSGSGLTAGVALRIRRLVISQRIIGLEASSYSPLMIGWAF